MSKKLKSLTKRLAQGGVSIGAVIAGSAHAALPEAVTTSITTAQTDLVALYAALTAAGVIIWVGRLIYRKFTVR